MGVDCLVRVLAAGEFAWRYAAFVGESMAVFARTARSCFLLARKCGEQAALAPGFVGISRVWRGAYSLLRACRLADLGSYVVVTPPGIRGKLRRRSAALRALYERLKVLQSDHQTGEFASQRLALELNERACQQLFLRLLGIELDAGEAKILSRYPSVLIALVQFLEHVGCPAMPPSRIMARHVAEFVLLTRDDFGRAGPEQPVALRWRRRLMDLPYHFRARFREFWVDLREARSRIDVAFAAARSRRRCASDAFAQRILLSNVSLVTSGFFRLRRGAS